MNSPKFPAAEVFLHTVCTAYLELCNLYAYTLIHVYNYTLYACVTHVPMCVHICMCKYVGFLCTHVITYVWCYFKLLQHFHTYSNINTPICTIPCLNLLVWLKRVAYKLIKQWSEFYTNPTTSFLYLWSLQPSSIVHRIAWKWTNLLIYTISCSIDSYTTCLSQNASKQDNALEQYHTSLCYHIANTVQYHMTSHYIIHTYSNSWELTIQSILNYQNAI